MEQIFRVDRTCRRGKHWLYKKTAFGALEILKRCIKSHEECIVTIDGHNNEETNWAGQNTKIHAPKMSTKHKWWYGWDSDLLGF